MRTDTPVTIHRHDYLPYPFHIDRVELEFDLDPATTRVLARYQVRRREAADTSSLRLNGEALELIEVRVDGQPWPAQRQRLESGFLILDGLPAQALLEITSHCHPADNTTLMGLYVSNDVFFTQCEAEGFRRIAWFPDRPDVMSVYTVVLRADPGRYPILLSNGNLQEETRLPDGRLQARWHDPFPKPSYLFALVAGKLGVREKTVATRSGRPVLLQVYCDPGNENKTEWALACLERSLRWDEQRFDLELDLDRFMIVAVRDFNMGAMENKGLNIFNAAYVLADPDTATDANYRAIEAVIGHEYFHNWTGNRVTCRDWFQLSLKEGLTVFRDQEFTADMMAAALAEAGGLEGQALERAQDSARAVKRIDDVQALRAAQFPEDAGPMAHPIRPESYQEIGNFYTATVYEKGAEVIRMQHTLLGEAGFQAGMAEYFRRHDGQAVTCDDFVAAMESIYVSQNPGRDLERFREWYRQAGTPRVSVTLHHDAASRRCTVTLSQRNPPVGVERLEGATVLKPALHIPFAIGLISASGQPVPLRLEGSNEPAADTLLLELTGEEAQWTFVDIEQPPVPSLLRDFSAPVRVAYDYSDRDLALLLAHDGNAFARWEAGQELATRHLLALAAAFAQHDTPPSSGAVIEAWRAVLADGAVDPAWRARALALPSERLLAERQSLVQPQALAQAREALRALLGRELAGAWREVFLSEAVEGPYSPDPLAAGRRDLRHLALGYWLAGDPNGDGEARREAAGLYQQATNMTERMAALGALLSYARHDSATTAALAHFYKRWHDDPLVVDKWFALQATALGSTVADVRALMAHPAFTLRNPNRARALVFQFCLNQPQGFHQADGQGYAFWQEQVLALDAINPEIAARLARALEQFRRYDAPWRQAMEDALTSVRAHPGLSRNVTEIVAKALEISA